MPSALTGPGCSFLVAWHAGAFHKHPRPASCLPDRGSVLLLPIFAPWPNKVPSSSTPDCQAQFYHHATEHRVCLLYPSQSSGPRRSRHRHFAIPTPSPTGAGCTWPPLRRRTLLLTCTLPRATGHGSTSIIHDDAITSRRWYDSTVRHHTTMQPWCTATQSLIACRPRAKRHFHVHTEFCILTLRKGDATLALASTNQHELCLYAYRDMALVWRWEIHSSSPFCPCHVLIQCSNAHRPR